MALTEKTDSSSDGFVEVERPGVELPEREGSAERDDSAGGNAGAAELTQSNVEEHDSATAGEAEARRRAAESGSPDDGDDDDDASEARTSVAGAGVLLGLSGLLLGGPLLGLLAGAGGAYAASEVDGPAGDAARAAGDVAAATGEAAREANERHGALDKIREALAAGWRRAKELNEEHGVGERAKEAANNVREKSIEFEQNHHVAENVLKGIQNGIDFLLGKVREVTSDGSPGGDSGETKTSS